MSFGLDFNFGNFGFGFAGGGSATGGTNLGIPSVFGIGSSLQQDPATRLALVLAARGEGAVAQPTVVIPIDPAIGDPVTITEMVGDPNIGALIENLPPGGQLPPPGPPVGVGGQSTLGGVFGGIQAPTTLGGFLNVGVIDDIADLTVAIGGIGRGVLGSPGNIVIDRALGLTGPIQGLPGGQGDVFGQAESIFMGGRFGFGPLGDLAIGLARQVLFPEPDAPRQQAGISDLFGILPEALRQPGATRALPGFIGEAADFLSGLFTGGDQTMGCGPVVPVAPRAGFPRSLIIPFQDQFGKQKVKFYRDRGQPILFTGDRAVVRSWNRVVGPARRIGTGHRKRRRR